MVGAELPQRIWRHAFGVDRDAVLRVSECVGRQSHDRCHFVYVEDQGILHHNLLSAKDTLWIEAMDSATNPMETKKEVPNSIQFEPLCLVMGTPSLNFENDRNTIGASKYRKCTLIG